MDVVNAAPYGTMPKLLAFVGKEKEKNWKLLSARIVGLYSCRNFWLKAFLIWFSGSFFPGFGFPNIYLFIFYKTAVRGCDYQFKKTLNDISL